MRELTVPKVDVEATEVCMQAEMLVDDAATSVGTAVRKADSAAVDVALVLVVAVKAMAPMAVTAAVAVTEAADGADGADAVDWMVSG